TMSEDEIQNELCSWTLYSNKPSAMATITPPARTREGETNVFFTSNKPFPSFDTTCVLFGTKTSISCASCTPPGLLSTACAPPQSQQTVTKKRSSTAEVKTRREILGLRGSLSLPSLLLQPDPVTPRRLCVRGAFTAATRESIQICVCVGGVCAVAGPLRVFEFHSSD
ncbi:exo-alpha-sialidase, partial [Trypanosoma cruzi]